MKIYYAALTKFSDNWPDSYMAWKNVENKNLKIVRKF